MDDLISRKVAIDWIKGWFDTDKHYHPYSQGKTIPTCEVMDILERVPSAEPEIIYCKDCKHHIDGRCLVANHHTVDHECCAEVFGAERKEDALN